MKKVEARGSPGEVRKLESTPQTSLEIEKTALPLLIKPELETIITDFSVLACKATVGAGRVFGRTNHFIRQPGGLVRRQ